MKRQQIIQKLIQNMHAFGRVIRSSGSHEHHLSPGMPTRAQMSILIAVSRDSGQGIKDLAQKFGMTPSAVTQLVNGLVKEDLLTRKETTADRRKMSLQLTETGKKKMQQLKNHREKMITKILEPLTDSELQQLGKLQQKITDQLTILWTKKHHKK